MFLPTEIENPVTGGRIRFDEVGSSEDILLMESWEPAGGTPPPPHYHPSSDEVFHVHEGHIVLEVDGVKHRVGPDETLTVPAGATHRFWTVDEAVHFTAEVRPAGRWRAFMTDFFSLFHEHGELRGLGGLLQMVLFAEAYRDTVQLASPPPTVQRFLFPVLAIIARLTGRRASYPYPDEPGYRDTHDLAEG